MNFHRTKKWLQIVSNGLWTRDRTILFFSMGFEILGLEFKAKNARTTERWWREGCKMSAPSTLGLLVR